MKTASASLSLILYLLLSTLPGPSLSQTQEPQSAQEALRQQSQQHQQEYRQRVDEQREQMIRRQEEFNQRVEKQESQRLQELWPSLSPEERQRREQEQQRREEQRRQSIQRQREFWQQDKEREKERQQWMEEQKRKEAERQKAIRKVANEYSDEVWREALGTAPNSGRRSSHAWKRSTNSKIRPISTSRSIGSPGPPVTRPSRSSSRRMEPTVRRKPPVGSPSRPGWAVPLKAPVGPAGPAGPVP